MGFPSSPLVKKSACNAKDAEDLGLIPRLEKSPGEENGNPFQYTCLENSMDRGALLATVHGVTKESDTIEPLNMHALSQSWLRQGPPS